MKKWKLFLICLFGILQLSAFAAPKEKKAKKVTNSLPAKAVLPLSKEGEFMLA